MATNADYLDELPCQNGGGGHVPLGRPWRGTQYAEDKEKFFKIARQNRYDGHPTRISDSIKAVYGDDYTNTEYKRLSRFAKRSDWFVIGPNNTIEVTAECFKAAGLESVVSVSPKDAPSCDSACQKKPDRETESKPEVKGESYPKDRVNAIRDKRTRLDDGQYNDKHDYRAELLRELATYRAQIDDKHVYFRRKHAISGLPNHLITPYTTRYNDTGKATAIREGFEKALRTASEGYNAGVMVSLTVDSKRFESHAEATEAAMDSVSNLIGREAYQQGKRPEYIRVNDYQRNGLIHFHVCMFGVHVAEGDTETGRPTVSEASIREYWDTQRGIGSQIAVQPIHERNGEWILHNDDGGRQTVRLYLGKRIRELSKIASMTPDELRQTAESGNSSLWRHALFWATQRRYFTASESLRDTTEAGTSSKYAWEFVGVCRFEQIPQYVIDDSVNFGRPPPDTEAASMTDTAA